MRDVGWCHITSMPGADQQGQLPKGNQSARPYPEGSRLGGVAQSSRVAALPIGSRSMLRLHSATAKQ